MFLKNLSIIGFKSFAEKTSLNFQRGITAIVGPNGCGKSNIADAIRWVLGEQSAKALRGGEMADVIFNGTEKRKPLGMAEVSLTIGDFDKDRLKAAGIEIEFNEVTITRRVFRDGTSEYLINKTPCRLRDIQQLFMGTGIGRSSYSIMAQGQITQILSSRPEDRRIIFEEAAGITKFKSQKKEALRKLELTEQNLLRLSDLIREVKRQIGSLQRQAGKARRYKQISGQLQYLETQLARHQFDLLESEITERASNLEKVKSELTELAHQVSKTESEINDLRTKLSELEQLISETNNRSLEIKSQIEQHHGTIKYAEDTIQHLDNQYNRALSDISQAEERLATAKNEIAVIESNLTASDSKIKQSKSDLDLKLKNLASLESEINAKDSEVKNLQTTLFAKAQQLSRTRNELNTLDLQKQGSLARFEKLQSEKIQLIEEHNGLQKRLESFQISFENEKQNVEQRRASAQELTIKIRNIQNDIDKISKELEELLRHQAAIRSKLNILEQLQAAYEGFSPGTLAAMKQTPNVLGTLVDKIRVPEKYLVAIEAALGYNLQLILTSEPEAACSVLKELNLSRKGKAAICPLKFQSMLSNSTDLTDSHGQNHDPAPENQTPGLLQEINDQNIQVPALSVMEIDSEVLPLVSRLLKDIVIVTNLDEATKLWINKPGQFKIVTLNGEILDQNGVYFGGAGSNKENSAASILGRKNQIASLQNELASIQEQITTKGKIKGSISAELNTLQSALKQVQLDLQTQEVEMAQRQGEFRALQNSLKILAQKIETVEFEAQTLNNRITENEQQRQTLIQSISQLETQEQEANLKLQALNSNIAELSKERERLLSEINAVKIALASDQQIFESLKRQHSDLISRINELESLQKDRKNEIDNIISRKHELASQIEESQLAIESLQHERDTVNIKSAALAQQATSVRQEISARETLLQNLRQRINTAQENRNTLEVELAQKKMASEHLLERIHQKYQINLCEIRSECITITFADGTTPQIQTLTPEEMAAKGLATDWAAVADQVAALQKKLDEMGPVNLVAIEEFEETEQRYKFLLQQEEDLIKAKQQLVELITKIDSQTKEMFSETFNQIRKNFSELFIEVFGGGQADLLLSDSSGILESGIEIMARPPGKQFKNISLLSGGEQTMVAVALLFAIYLVKPSPFCVLDELDAALDEINIGRFISVLKRFLEKSQFIIMTHSKRTMATANTIYGVTMEENGVSKIVSLRFKKDEFEPNGKLEEIKTNQTQTATTNLSTPGINEPKSEFSTQSTLANGTSYPPGESEKLKPSSELVSAPE
jgi:chromosome segregation protein